MCVCVCVCLCVCVCVCVCVNGQLVRDGACPLSLLNSLVFVYLILLVCILTSSVCLLKVCGELTVYQIIALLFNAVSI